MSMPFYVSPEQWMGQAQTSSPGHFDLTRAVRDRGLAVVAAGGQPS